MEEPHLMPRRIKALAAGAEQVLLVRQERLQRAATVALAQHHQFPAAA